AGPRTSRSGSPPAGDERRGELAAERAAQRPHHGVHPRRDADLPWWHGGETGAPSAANDSPIPTPIRPDATKKPIGRPWAASTNANATVVTAQPAISDARDPKRAASRPACRLTSIVVIVAGSRYSPDTRRTCRTRSRCSSAAARTGGRG